MDQRQATLETLIQPTVEGLGYDLVRVVVSGRHRPTLQIMAERHDRRPMTVEDCESISRAISAKLDVEDPLPEAYTLEVSSPGIDRPLIRTADFQRFAGHLAKVESRVPVAGQRRFTGSIMGADARIVRLSTATGEVELPVADIARAKLVLTEDLIRAAQAEAAPVPAETATH
jgi:ribosome maturation factor RimP